MTKRLFDENSHLKGFSAEVLSCEEIDGKFKTELTETAFFPEAGGQGCDKGVLGGTEVLSVLEEEGEIFHIISSPLEVGSIVKGEIDWERRFDFMQQHSAEHILSGIAHSLYGCENVGFHLSEDIVTFDFDKPLRVEQIAEIERLANEVVFNNTPFKAFYPDDETLKTLTYRSKKEIEGRVRIVEIDDVDSCACCAPHVDFAGEIGLIKICACEALRGGVRLTLKAGKRAFCEYGELFDNVKKISSLLCVKQSEVFTATKRIFEGESALKSELAALKRTTIEEKLYNFKSPKNTTANIFEGLEIKDLQYFSDLLFKNYGGIRAILSPKEDGFAFAVCGDDAHLAEFFTKLKAAFKVKGGGRGSMMQGTVFANEEEILNFFKNCN